MKQLYEAFVDQGVQLSIVTLLDGVDALINSRDALIKSVPQGRSQKLYYLVPYPTGCDRVIAYLTTAAERSDPGAQQRDVQWMIASDASGAFVKRPRQYGDRVLIWTDNIHLAALLYHLHLNENQLK